MAAGGCLCGAVRYEYTGEVALTALCHCTDCKRWGGAAFLPNVVVSRSSFKITAGEPKAFDINGASGKLNRHFFCGDCGSSLYCELEVMPDNTAIKAGSLDNPDIAKWDAELYAKDRLSYVQPIEGAAQNPTM